MSSPGSPSGENLNQNFSHTQIAPANSGGDLIDIASFAQKIDVVSFLSENNPDPADTLDVDVTIDSNSILAGGVPFQIDDTLVTEDEINIPVDDTLTNVNVGDLIRCDRTNANGAGMGINLINVYKNTGSERQNRVSPSGASQRQEFLSIASLLNTQSISQPLQVYPLFDQANFIIQVILDVAMAGGETISFNIFQDGASLTFDNPFVLDDTSPAGVIINVPVSLVNTTLLAGVPLQFDYTYSAGAGGTRIVSARLIGD